MGLDLGDAFGSGLCGSHGGDVRNSLLDGILAQIAVIVDRFLAAGGVDNHLDLAVGHQIQNVRTSLIELLHPLYRDVVLLDEVAGGACGHQLEAVLIEALRNLRNLRLVLGVDGDECGAFGRKDAACALLGLEEGLAGGSGDSENLAGGTHLRSENRVNLLEHIEGEDCFLDAVVRNLALAEGRYR